MAAPTKSLRSSAEKEIKQQDIKQAIVVADNFNENLAPLTSSEPSVLLPVVSGTLLEYVLQLLEECGIDETYIFCCSNNQQIRSYISSSRWSGTDSSMSVFVISSTTFMSLGDAIRELDSRALIRSDFILLRGGVIFNFRLTDMLEEHKKRRQTDKSSALTLLYRRALPNHKTRCKEDDILVAVESSSQKIRYYQRINNNKSISIPLEVFQENEEVSIHYDLLDTHIAVCSPCLPPLFSDNVDYETLDDFVKGQLNEELLGNSMYIHVSKTGYAGSLSNFYMYDAVSQDILSRWSYPLVPDVFKVDGCQYSHSRHNIYKASNVEIGRNCSLKQNVAIGNNTKIGEGCCITNSVIGDNCVIGRNVEIKGSYLWSDVTVGDNCKLDTCLLAEKVTVHNNVSVKPGCVLGSEVVIKDDIVLEEYTKLQSHLSVEEDEYSFEEEELAESRETKAKQETCDVSLVGTNGHGYLCHSPNNSDDSIVDVWGKLPDDNSFDDETESSSSGVREYIDDYDDRIAIFYSDVMESLQSGIKKKDNIENLILEINASKLTTYNSYNITMKDVNTLLIKVILRIPLENQEKEMSVQEYLASMKNNLLFFYPLVSHYIRSFESQLECLSSVEEFMKENENLCPAMIKVIHFWYDKDILNEAVIHKWYQNISPENENIKKQASSFIKWLQEADEESSDSE